MFKKAIMLSVMAVVALSVTSVWAAPKVIAAKFHSDNCGSCKVMAPAVGEVKSQYGEGDVLFVTFDRTSETTSNQSKLLAHALGLGDIYDATAKTGKVLLIDADSKEVRGTLNKTHSSADMAMALDTVLGGQSFVDQAKDTMKKEMHKMDGSMKGSNHGSKKGSY